MKTLPELSVIIPAFNEEDFLPETLASLKNAVSVNQISTEVIVVNNNSTDNTAEVAEKGGANVVFERENQISRARNRGAEEATGKYFIFLDADSIVTPELLNKAITELRSGKYLCGGALVKFDSEIGWLHRKGVNLWNKISKRFNLAAGCFIFCHRSLFNSIGGFSTKYYAGEELVFSRKAKKTARKNNREFLIIDSPQIITSTRKLKWFSIWKQFYLCFIFLIFPLAPRYKSLCGYWYNRPEK